VAAEHQRAGGTHLVPEVYHLNVAHLETILFVVVDSAIIGRGGWVDA
jgi:hypothetical protein